MRSEVMWFANQMEKKLNRRMASKDGWYDTKIRFLLYRLLEEVKELLEACQKEFGLYNGVKDLNKIIDECVDVANFAMMIADKMKNIQRERG